MGMGMFGIGHGFFTLLFAAIFVVPCWKIIVKAGYDGWWSLLALVPLVNIVALWVFAFSEWPAQSKAITHVPESSNR